MEFISNKLPRAGRENYMDQLKGGQTMHAQHMISACLPFCQWVSRSRQAEPRVFTIL